jgi:phage-related protein
MKNVWNATVVPFWNIMEEGMAFWVNVFKGEWGKALDNLKTIWNSTWGKLWNGLKNRTIDGLRGLKLLWNSVTGAISEAFNNTIGKAFEKLQNSANNVFDSIGKAWDSMVKVMQSVYDDTVGKMFDEIGGVLGSISGIRKSVVGGMEDLIPGGSGGGGGGTTVGTAVSGGLAYNLNMSFNLSGMTDATDKREMAREIGGLIQEEITRSTGGGRMRGRYS